jgi:hypothetical protein
VTRLRRLACLTGCLCVLAAPPAAAITATVVDVRKIADDAPHSAFTDLVDWRSHLVCAFRQGRGHVSTDGRIVVLTSQDGEQWTKTAELSLEGFDLRDASLSEMPDGRLMLLGGAAPRRADNESSHTGSFVAFSDDARTWTTPEIVVPPGRWLWRVSWRDGQAYGVSYGAPDNNAASSLLASRDGRSFSELVPQLLPTGYPTEAVIRFAADGTAYCLHRRDGDALANSAYLGVSQPPYDAWSWHDLGLFFGGPNLLQTPVGDWIAAGRIIHDDGPKTDIALVDVTSHTLTSLVSLPSGGDTSYPGLVWRDETLWVSYYSSHEGKTSIYLARVKLNR